jgi:hypothetical protein
VLDLPLLEPFVHAGLDLFAQRVHLVRLLLDQGRLRSHYLLVSLLHVPLALLFLHLLALDLNLVCLGILLLAGKLLLDLLEVEEFGGLLEGEGQLLLEEAAVLLEVADVFVFERANRLLVLLLDLGERLVPPLVEVLILHQVRLLHFFPLSRLVIDQLLPPPREVLYLQFLNAVLGHLCLHILALHFALLSVLFKYGTKHERELLLLGGVEVLT